MFTSHYYIAILHNSPSKETETIEILYSTMPITLIIPIRQN